MTGAITFSTAWCSTFRRRGRWPTLRPAALPAAYRAPALFTRAMLAGGANHVATAVDEDLDGRAGTFRPADVAYLCTHGEREAQGYEFLTQAASYPLAEVRATVVVADTCDLTDGPASTELWRCADLDRSVRMLLGFAGPATIDPGSSDRARVFVKLLDSGRTIADAWCQAVQQTAFFRDDGRYDRPTVVAFGDTLAEAEAIMGDATLDMLLAYGPRVAGPTQLVVR